MQRIVISVCRNPLISRIAGVCYGDKYIASSPHHSSLLHLQRVRGCGNRYRSEKPGRIIVASRRIPVTSGQTAAAAANNHPQNMLIADNVRYWQVLRARFTHMQQQQQQTTHRETHRHTNKWLINLRECDRTMPTLDGRVRTTHRNRAHRLRLSG